MGRFAGRLAAGQRHHAGDGRIGRAGLAGFPGLVAEQAGYALFGVAALPAPDRGSADAGAPGDLGDAQPIGRMEDDPGALHVLQGLVPIGDERLETSAILTADEGADVLSHPPRMPHPSPCLNPMNAPVH
jgi:hypothetical protein